jgi:hypothetical protein
LLPEVSRANAVHQNDRRRNDRPSDNASSASEAQKLGRWPQPNKPRIRVRPQKEPTFRKISLQERVASLRKPCSQTSILLLSQPNSGAPCRPDALGEFINEPLDAAQVFWRILRGAHTVSGKYVAKNRRTQRFGRHRNAIFPGEKAYQRGKVYRPCVTGASPVCHQCLTDR